MTSLNRVRSAKLFKQLNALDSAAHRTNPTSIELGGAAMDCSVKVVMKDGKEFTYPNAVLKKEEKGFLHIYQPDEDGNCASVQAKFDPCEVKSVYVG